MQELIPLTMQEQEQTKWCWAAVSSSVSVFLSQGDPNSAMTQCDIANRVLKLDKCCTDGGSSECNQTALLDDALRCIGHMNGNAYEGTASFASIVQLTSAPYRVPIGVRVEIGGEGHFLLLVGFNTDSGKQWVRVADPLYGSHSYDYNEFCSAYQSGRWTHTYPIA